MSVRTTIGVIDDEPFFRATLREYLHLRGFEVVEARGCQEAESLFRTNPPALTILDHEMHDGNSLQLIPKLRQLAPKTPVIILTGLVSQELAVRVLQLGAARYLTKPISLLELASIIQRLLDSREVSANTPASVDGSVEILESGSMKWICTPSRAISGLQGSHSKRIPGMT